MAIVALLVLIALLIPFKILGFKSLGNQTTTYTSNPLKWAITHSGSDKNGFISDTDSFKLAFSSFVQQYGGNYSLLYKCIVIESGWQENPRGWNDGGLAYGIAQFHKPTFLSNCKGEYRNTYDQLNCFVKMNADHKDKNWSCWIKITSS